MVKSFENETDMYVRAMFGEHAVRTPLNFVVQNGGGHHNGLEVISFVGMSAFGANHPLRFGSTRTHQLVICDAVIRPHVVVESDYFAGTGLGGLIRSGMDYDEWIHNGNILIKKF